MALSAASNVSRGKNCFLLHNEVKQRNIKSLQKILLWGIFSWTVYMIYISNKGPWYKRVHIPTENYSTKHLLKLTGLFLKKYFYLKNNGSFLLPRMYLLAWIRWCGKQADTNGYTTAQWFKLSWQVGYHKFQILAPSQTEHRLDWDTPSKCPAS